MAERRENPPRVPEHAARKLTARLTVSPGQHDWKLDGLPITQNMVGPLLSLLDWLNRLEGGGVRAGGSLAPDPKTVYKRALEKIAHDMDSGPVARDIAVGALAAGER